MGYDNRFKSMKRLEPTGTESQTNEPRTLPVAGESKSALEKQLARELAGDLQSREWTSPIVSNL